MDTLPSHNYGIEKFGRLKRVLLHRPDESIKLITEDNRKFFPMSCRHRAPIAGGGSLRCLTIRIFRETDSQNLMSPITEIK